MLISAENIYLTKGYNKKIIVNNVSVFLKQGEIVGLLGPNGAGKTSTFNILVGQEKCNSGNIYIDGDDITELPMWERANKGIGYLPQEPSIFRDLSVADNILLRLQLMNISKNEISRRLNYFLDKFELTNIKDREGRKLSGGQRRRVEIARLLAIEPKFILLDEPYAGVDPSSIKYLHILLKDLRDENIGILITDHNIDETLSITNRSYIMNDGKILKSGTTNDLINDTYVRQVYLGENFKLKTEF